MITVDEARTLLQAEVSRLRAVRAVLEAEQGVTIEGKRVVDVGDASPQDPAEVGDQFADRAEVLAELSGLDAELEALAGAQARIEAGTYGTCVDCGKAIPDERLTALPATLRCVDDQRRPEAA